MNTENKQLQTYIYNISYQEGEASLCALEMRSLFNLDILSHTIKSDIKIDPSRSPFIKERVDVIYEGQHEQEIIEKLKSLPLSNSTFKVQFVQSMDLNKVGFDKRRQVERGIGLHVPGVADLKNPDLLYAIMKTKERWIFGLYHKNEAVWLQHQKKPHSYSTALSTRVARSVVNIAIPEPTYVQAIDPCCGIGTVLIEALSMGADIVGSDINPLLMRGVRENVTHFGFTCEISLKDIREVKGCYDVAIIDMPYNLCSVITEEEQLEMLQRARTFTKKLVIINVGEIDHIINRANFSIIDRGIVRKSNFIRHVIICT